MFLPLSDEFKALCPRGRGFGPDIGGGLMVTGMQFFRIYVWIRLFKADNNFVKNQL